VTARLFRERSGEEIHGRPVRVQEDEPIRIVVRTRRDFVSRPELSLDGETIGAPEPSPDGDDIAWHWRFRSESWCGRTFLNLATDAGSLEIALSCTPNDSKYSEHEYERMLDHVLSHGSTLAFGLAPGETDAAFDKTSEALKATHPAVIDCYLGELREQLRRVLADPVREQRRDDRYTRLLTTRPITPRTLTWLSSHPNQWGQVRSGGLDVECLQQVRFETFDHAANRYVVTLLRRLRRSFEATAAALAKHATKQLINPAEQNRARVFAHRVRQAAREMSIALRHPVLAELASGELTEGVAQVFADHPAYGRFSRLASRLLDPALSLRDGAELASSLRRSWDLFELYCLYRLIEALESELGDAWAFDHSPLAHHVLTTPSEGRCWDARHADGRRLVLFYQQHFGAAQAGAISITTARRPDFILAAFDGNRLRSWTLLDAKYRTAEVSIRDALESMHVYRDSLRWRCESTNIEQAANGGFLLVPTIAEGSRRYGEPAFIQKRRLGLVGIDASELGAVLLGQTWENGRD